MNTRFPFLPHMKKAFISLLAAGALSLFGSPAAFAEKIMIPIGKAHTMQAPGVTKIIAVKDGVVEVLNVSEQEVILSGVGMAPDITQIIYWDATGQHVVDVETFREADLIQRKFSTLVTVPGVTLTLFPDAAYLRGFVDSQDKIKEISTIATTLVTDRKLINLMGLKEEGKTYKTYEQVLKERIIDAIKVPTVKVTVLNPRTIMTTNENDPGANPAASATQNLEGLIKIVLEGSVQDQMEYQHLQEVVRGFVTSEETQISNLVTIENPIQVVFQAYVLQVSKDNTRDLGIKWGGTSALGGDPSSGILNFTENITNAFRGDAQAAGAPIGKYPNPFKMNNINRFDLIAARVQAWESQGKVKVVANPKLLVYANAKATKIAKSGWIDETTSTSGEGEAEGDGGLAFVKVGQDIYYPSTIDASGNPTYAAAQATLKLVVRDLFVKDDDLKFSVFAKQDEPSFTRGTNAPPNILKRSVMTTVKIKNNETVVLGGLINESDSLTRTGVPGLSRLPLVGKFFRTTSVLKSKNELVILLTPQIVGRDTGIGNTKKFETVPVPRRTERLEQLHEMFQQIKGSHFPSENN
ncbi:MAG TPA: type II and III secretion system protein [Candidatus Ozemobacteraceae bacterium]|nr:type II and III secretion system protein [Candidatus Ozemobacteraceae bacterium]